MRILTQFHTWNFLERQNSGPAKWPKFAVFGPLKLQNLSGSKIPKFPHCVEETKVLTYLEYHEMSLKIQLIFRLKTNFHFSSFFHFCTFVYIFKLCLQNWAVKSARAPRALNLLFWFLLSFWKYKQKCQFSLWSPEFTHFYPQPRIEVSGTKVQNHDFKTLKVD